MWYNKHRFKCQSNKKRRKTMKVIAMFDSKKYDIDSFSKIMNRYPNYQIKYYEVKLSKETAVLAKGCDAVCAFVNDIIDEDVINILDSYGIEVLALRCAGYNNVDIKAAYNHIHVLRVPAYSPYAIAEHAMALLLSLNRKIHKAYIRTRDFNFSLQGLLGFDLHGKTIGIIGTGKIGQALINICNGFGMKTLAYDMFCNPNIATTYVELDQLIKTSDIISLHLPLTNDTRHLINQQRIEMMKNGCIIINTSRGGLIDSKALLNGLQTKKLGGACLDVYEEEADLFFEDNSNEIIQDDILSLLISLPNVIITSHQGYFTQEALEQIAITTLDNINDYFTGNSLKNEVCYKCLGNNSSKCFEKKKSKCW